MLMFPFGDPASTSVETEAVGGGLSHPRTDGCASRSRCRVDGVGQVGRE